MNTDDFVLRNSFMIGVMGLLLVLSYWAGYSAGNSGSRYVEGFSSGISYCTPKDAP